MKKIFIYVLLLFIGLGNVHAQDPTQYGTPYANVPYLMDANIYQMNLREYSSSRDIAGARAKLQRIKDLGINVLYLMPIYPVGVTKNPDGSPYSHKDLKSVASDLGTLSDLRGLVEDAHSMGMAVILDWVANQTAWDHPWISDHPDWYHKDGSGNIISPTAGSMTFKDVAWLDLDNPDAAAAMVDAMRYWVFAANVDGFRFDWADKAPPTFWTNTITNLRGITTHDLLLLAEGSNEGTTSGCTTCEQNQPGYHYDQGFDFIFGTNFYWNVMKKVWKSGEPVTNLDGVTTGEYTGASSSQMVARFLSDHDDYNADGSPFSFMPSRDAVMSAFAVIAYHRGVPFIYNGIEVGNTNALPYPWNSGNINWTQDLTVYTEMQSMLSVRNKSEALRRGQPDSYITSSNPDVIAFTKTSGAETAVVLVNVRNGNKSFTVPAGMAGVYNNLFTNEAVTLTEGSSVTLSAFEYLVLSNVGIDPVAVTGVSLNQTSISLKEGLTQQLTATISPADATNKKVTWSTSNASIATVNNGLVTAAGVGSATITVTTDDGGFTANCQVTVTEASHFKVYFYKPTNWGTGINIYYWDTDPADVMTAVNWPGVAMTKVSDGLYSFTFTNVNSTNLIFNDGTNQTADLTRNTEGWYKEGAWYNTDPGPIDVVQDPYGGTKWAIPGTIEAEDYDTGGEGVAYHDNDAANNGGKYRTDQGVDIEDCSEGGYNVGWVNKDEWLEYSVNIPSAGTYSVAVRVASAVGGSFHIEFDGIDKTGTLTVPNTNGWQSWQTVSATGLSLSAGTQIMRVYMDGSNFNINKYTFTSGTTNPVTGVSVSPTSASLTVDGTQQLTETVSPTNATNKTVTWSSSNNSVASVSSSGLITANAEGTATITVTTQDGGYTATCSVTVTAAGSTYYAIKNRWTGDYLNDAGDNAGYSGSIADNNHLWELVDVNGTYKRIVNAGTGEPMHIEDLTGKVQCAAIDASAWSSQWTIENVDGTYKRLRNRWKTADIIHIENKTGLAEYENGQDGWYSAQWQLVPASLKSKSTKVMNDIITTKTDNRTFSMYPNPVKGGTVNVYFPDNESNVDMLFYNLQGKIILRTKVSKGENLLNLPELSKGLYMVVVKGLDINYAQKILIE